MEYPEIWFVIVAVVAGGTLLRESSLVQRRLNRWDERFHSNAWCMLGIASIALCYTTLVPGVSPETEHSLVAVYFATVLLAPAFGWLLFRNAPAGWLRGVGVLGFVYPVAYFVRLIIHRR